MRTRRQAREQASQDQEKKSPQSIKQLKADKKKKKQPKKDSPIGTKKLKVQEQPPKQSVKSRKDKVKRVEEQTKVQSSKEEIQVKKPSNRKKSQRLDDKQLAKKLSPSKANDEQITKKDEVEEVKIKKIQFRGKAPIDDYFPLDKSKFHILQHNGKIYSATLNQTAIQVNSNKFYILQILQSESNQNSCYFFTRWGRVGVPGQTSNLGPMNISFAIKNFESKHRQKAHKGDYRQIELNYGVQDEKKEVNNKTKAVDKKDNQTIFNQSKLPVPVKKLIELIFDLKMMERQMVEIGYNVNKMPLGKLSKDNIMRGYKILEELMGEIKGKKRRQKIEELTNDFYSYIPHDFGFTKMHLHILDSQEKVKKKIEMLQALAEIKVATSIISQGSIDENRIDANYQKLNRQIKPIQRNSKQFQIINKYLQTTHAQTHRSYELELQDLFSLASEVEDIRYTKDIPNKMLLWHGSRLTNFVGILSQGLRIAPPQAPVTGYMFGKGVYFADMSSKSANYCFTNKQNNTGILLLCEVALGNMNQKYHADYYASNLPSDKHSTKGVGRTAPIPENYVDLNGVTIPMGPGQQNTIPGCSLQYNQFIVYDIAQIKIRYLLRTKFNYKH